MSISYLGQVNGSEGTGATSTTIATSSTFNLTTGSHVFVHVRWEETTTTCTVADDNGGGNTYTGLTIHNSTVGTDAYSKLFYCLAANGGATTTWTATFGAARAYRSIRVMVFSADGTLTYDSVDVGGSDNGTVTTIAASPFSMTGDGLVIAGSVTFSTDDPVSFVGDVGGTYTMLAEAFNYCAEAYLITTALTGEDVTFTGTNVGRRAISVAAFTETITAQTSVPTSDITSGWTPSTGGTLYGTIDEASPGSDTDYDYASTAATMEVKFAALTDPTTAYQHQVKYRIAGASTGNLTVSLRQGSSQIASWVHTPPAAITTYTGTLTSAEAESITDYTDLRLRVVSST